MNKILCIYHGPECADGFAAAWAVRHALGDSNVEFFGGEYGKPPPDVKGRRVLLVDFSYKRRVLEDMAAEADGVLILDHHKTAQADLADLESPPDFKSWHEFDGDIPIPEWAHIAAVFDMARSGAGLTWDYLHPGQPRPLFIDYVEDRDLWTKRLPGVDEFTTALRSWPMTFKAWDSLFLCCTTDGAPVPHARNEVTDVAAVDNLIHEGRALMRYYRARLEELKGTAYQGYFPGRFGDVLNPAVAVCNAPYCFASDLASEIIDLFPGVQFGVVYFEDGPGQYKYSLRSRDDKMDCSLVASKLGGGGHRNASGFSTRRIVHERA